MFEIRMGEQGEIIMTGRLDAAQCDKALQFMDGVPAPRVVDLAGLDYVSCSPFRVPIARVAAARAALAGDRS